MTPFNYSFDGSIIYISSANYSKSNSKYCKYFIQRSSQVQKVHKRTLTEVSSAKPDYVKTYGQTRSKWIHQWPFNILEVKQSKREGKNQWKGSFCLLCFNSFQLKLCKDHWRLPYSHNLNLHNQYN